MDRGDGGGQGCRRGGRRGKFVWSGREIELIFAGAKKRRGKGRKGEGMREMGMRCERGVGRG